MRRVAAAVTTLLLLIPASWVALAPAAEATSADVVISQVYGGGGNSGAPYTNDFVELFNRGATTVSLTGMSVQYASATGTGTFGMNPVTVVSGSVAPGQYYLVQLAGGFNGIPLPTPDATGSANMSATNGKVALVNSTSGLACNGGTTPCSSVQLAQIVDLVGYGTADFYEGSPAPALTNATAALRKIGGCTETDNNGSDFVAAAPDPRNTASVRAPCSLPPGAPVVDSATAGDGSITVAWTAPGSDGGSPITDYEYRLDGAGGWTSLGTTASPAVITGLTNGTTYGVELRAVNAVGSGAASNAVSVTPSATPAPKPTVTPSATPTPTPKPTPKPTPTPKPGKKVQKPANGKGVPPKRIKLAGLTVLQGANARTNAGQRIRIRVKGGPARSSIAGEVRYFKVIRGPKGKTSIRTYGRPNLRIVVRQKAPATKTYRQFTKKTVYVDGRRRQSN